MDAIEGQISLDLYLDNKEDTIVRISSSRPMHVAKILIGKTPEQVLAIIPLMFNICGVAQSGLALRCIQQSLDIRPEPAMEVARNMLLQAEVAKEHLLRIFLDWPSLFQYQPAASNLQQINRLTQDFTSALFSEGRAFQLDSQLDINFPELTRLIDSLEQLLTAEVFILLPDHWLHNQRLENILGWAEKSDSLAAVAINSLYRNGWGAQGVSDFRKLPQLDTAQLLQRLEQPTATDFLAAPDWQGHCYETTALCRQWQHPMIRSLVTEYQDGLLSRFLARLVELAHIPRQLRDWLRQLDSGEWQQENGPSDFQGIAQVESARGRLVHRVSMEDGLVSQYQILAPTEWNFHPRGVVYQSLKNIRVTDKQQYQHLAHLVVNAIDPCVGYQLRVH